MKQFLRRSLLPASACVLIAGTLTYSPSIAGDAGSRHYNVLSQILNPSDNTQPIPLIEAWSHEQPGAALPKSTGDVLTTPSQVYSHGEPTDDEQLMLEMINRARANPPAEGVRLVETEDANVQNGMQFFEIDPELVKSQFNTYPARPPLAFHPLLMNSAERHSMDMINNDFQDHTGSDNSSPFDRMNQANYTGWTRAGENIFAFTRSIWHGHAGFNIDWGGNNQVTLGHRKAIMNFESTVYSEVGISVEYENDQSTRVGPMIVTQNFGLRTTYYITGVVYNDLNDNDFYDQGEGLAGVEIMPDAGDFYAVTSQSGGYAIPVSMNSAISSVTASGGAISTPIAKNVSLTNMENFKLDFTPGDASSGLAAPTNLSPADQHVAGSNVVTLSWDAVADAATYEVEIFEGSPNGGISVFNDATLTQTSLEFTIPQLATDYFWHVRALAAGEAGEWSVMHSLRLNQQVPAIPILLSPRSFDSFEPGNIQFVWTPSADADSYRFIIAGDQFLSEPYVRDQELREQTVNIDGEGNWVYTFNSIGLLESNVQYWWTLQAVNAAGASAAATPQPFLVEEAILTSATLSAQIETSIVLSPSPADGFIRLDLELPAAAQVGLQVFDQTGRLALPALTPRRMGSGRQALELNTATLTPGVYNYRLDVDGKLGFGQIVIVR